MEDGSGWTPKDKKTETEVECYKKRHEGEMSKDRRSTKLEKVKFENSVHRPQIGKRLRKNSDKISYISNIFYSFHTR